MSALRKAILAPLKAVIDTVLPPRCIATGEIVDTDGMVSARYWKELAFIDAPFCDCCGQPFEFKVDEGALCGYCLYEHPPFDRARSALIYDDASKRLMMGFKYGDRLHGAPTMARWLTRSGFDLLKEADILIPVPLHPLRLWTRRYNQAAVLCQALSIETSIPTLADALIRTRRTKPHVDMSAKERSKNVKGAFALRPSCMNSVAGKTVVLVDDVYTTGATIRECARVLKQAGVNKVFVLTVARAIKGI